ncbi:MAG: single-stranded DNA-binding protein [Sulfurihydrogenibium sp.]|jgi:single-strand DNA-binding protein|nr:single-stranded DNA-binding protein [Sulfurihydrogenibium sp.]
MINKVMIEGRLMKNVEIRTLSSGRQAARLTLVHTRRYQTKNKEWKEEVSFFDVDVYSPSLIEKVRKLGKGDRILIEGEIRQNRWTNNNKTRSKIRIKATKVQLIAKPKTSVIAKAEKVTS